MEIKDFHIYHVECVESPQLYPVKQVSLFKIKAANSPRSALTSRIQSVELGERL